MTLPASLQAAFAAALVDELVRGGVGHVVVAPGSRSTVLALAVADAEDAGRLRLHVQLDERSAAFLALGIGLVSGRPAAVVTTSGSAAAHLLPATVEAHLARVPLVLCTADRPTELHGVGAAQTIEQDRLFDGFLRWSAHVGAVDSLPPGAWRSLASRAVAEATAGPAGPGPVQLNLGFREPLLGEPGGLVPLGRPDGRPWHTAVAGSRAPSPTELAGLAARLHGRPGVLIAGAGIADPDAVLTLAGRLGWPVLAEPRSGCRGRGDGLVVCSFDAILRSGGRADGLRPEIVVRLGAPPASKVLAGWVAASGAEEILVDPFGSWVDPDRSAAVVVAADPSGFSRALTAARPGPAPEAWAAGWTEAEQRAQAAIDGVLAGHAELTEPGVARTVTAALPGGTALLVGSSMPVRDVEWFGSPAMAARVVANRGANGIDGLVSTALGVAAGGGTPTVALLGDLAFLHDAGGLLGAVDRGVDCLFVVVDNHGGGIFSFLPQAALPERRFERLFGTPPAVDLPALARAHRLPVDEVVGPAALAPAVAEALAAGGVRVLTVTTDRSANVDVHAELQAAVAGALHPA